MSKTFSAIIVAALAGAAIYASRRLQDGQPDKQGTVYYRRTSSGGNGAKGALIDGVFGFLEEVDFDQIGDRVGNKVDDWLDRTPPAAQPRTSTPPASGRAPVGSDLGPGGVDFAAHERKYGLPAGYLRRTAEIESRVNPAAKNPRSSAGGLFQFIDATARDYRLGNRYDPHEATDAASRLARDNARHLRGVLGREPTAAELYLAHQQGAGGAARLLRDPSRKATGVVGSAAVKLNGGNSNMTAQDFANLWLNKFNKGYR